MLRDFIVNNYTFIFLMLVTGAFLISDKNDELHVNRSFAFLIFLAVLDTVIINIDQYLDSLAFAVPLRSVLMHIGYALDSGLMLATLLISERGRSRRYKRLLAMPQYIYMLLLTVSQFTGVIAYIRRADNTFVNGPLHFLTWMVLLLYLVLILRSAFRNDKRRMESVCLLISASVLCFNIVFEVVFLGNPGMTQTNIAICICSYYFYFVTNSYALPKPRIQKELLTAQTRTMISQIGPHFIYNSLACIAEVCHETAPEAEDAVITFSRYLRSCFDTLNDDCLVPFSRELETIRCYYQLEKLQSPYDIRLVLDIGIIDFMVPVLSIEALVENAFKHGLRPAHGGTVTLSVDRTSRGIEISIHDTGVGFPASPGRSDSSHTSSHLGLRNSRLRLKQQCNADISITSIPDKGTDIHIFIPEVHSNVDPDR